MMLKKIRQAIRKWRQEWKKKMREIDEEVEQEKIERKQERELKQKFKSLLDAIYEQQYATNEDYKAALKKHLLAPLGPQGEAFQISEVISVERKRGLLEELYTRFTFLIDDVNKQFVFFDLLTTPKVPAKIYHYHQIMDFKLDEIETMLTGTLYVHAMTINVFINEPDSNESKLKSLEPKVIFQVIPQEKVTKFQRSHSFYIEQKKLADQIMAALTYMKNNL